MDQTPVFPHRHPAVWRGALGRVPVSLTGNQGDPTSLESDI
jgi:hypothetical protein